MDRLTDGYPQQLSPDLERSMREGTLDLRPAFAEMGVGCIYWVKAL